MKDFDANFLGVMLVILWILFIIYVEIGPF